MPDPTVTTAVDAGPDSPVEGAEVPTGSGGPDGPGAAHDPSPAGPDADPADGDGAAADAGVGTEVAGEGPVYTIPRGDPTDFRMALVSSVTVDLPNQHPAVCLREMETPRRQLTFQVGLQDGVALSHAMRRIPTPRPLTHEVMTDVLQRFDIDLVAVRIVGRVGSVHFAELDLRGRSGRSVHACRPTDALILALHQPVPAPILVDARLLESGDDVPPPGAPA
ncbi:MAG TPA: bifunctional nuclease domain-containing protein [Acidimicrobiales bacterium]